jgi:hypothetical protein
MLQDYRIRQPVPSCHFRGRLGWSQAPLSFVFAQRQFDEDAALLNWSVLSVTGIGNTLIGPIPSTVSTTKNDARRTSVNGK